MHCCAKIEKILLSAESAALIKLSCNCVIRNPSVNLKTFRILLLRQRCIDVCVQSYDEEQTTLWRVGEARPAPVVVFRSVFIAGCQMLSLCLFRGSAIHYCHGNGVPFVIESSYSMTLLTKQHQV